MTSESPLCEGIFQYVGWFRDLDQDVSYQLGMLTTGVAHLITFSLCPVLHFCSARDVDRVEVWLDLDARLEALRKS
jgi:hypothetical protein